MTAPMMPPGLPPEMMDAQQQRIRQALAALYSGGGQPGAPGAPGMPGAPNGPGAPPGAPGTPNAPGAGDLAAGMLVGPETDPNPEPGPKPLTLMALPVEPEALDRARRAIGAMYGERFPLLLETQPDDGDWAAWAEGRWDAYAGPHRPAVHRAKRLRMMRAGHHWISSNRGSDWRVPPKPKDKIRATIDFFAPALDWRLQVQTEQRPGVKVIASNADADAQKRAVASQRLLEQQYREQRMRTVRKAAAYWAQTDGVSFLYPYWEPSAGPLFRDPATGRVQRLGDVRTTWFRIEQVRVSPDATTTNPPMVWVVEEDVPRAEAVAEYGPAVVDAGEDGGKQSGWGPEGMATDRALVARPSVSIDPIADPRLLGQETVKKRTVYCEPTPVLPNGLTLVVVGKKVVFLWGLLCGRVPLVPLRDGSTDPSFYPRPIADTWVEAQMQLNVAYSLLLRNLNQNAGGKVFARKNAILPDTLRSSEDVLVEVRSPTAIQDVLMPLQGFSIGTDALETINRCMKRLEDLTGWNDVARGAASALADSGRAILAIKDQLDRVFAPAVWDEAEAAIGWAKCTLAWAAFGFQLPRALRSLGAGRPDLGRMITRWDLDGAADIELDPQTMMPVTETVKRAQLDDWLNRGLITKRTYFRRTTTGWMEDLDEPDEVHAARAYRFVDAIKNALPPEPMLWQDDEGIWQDIIDREVLLAPNIDEQVRALADQRWVALAVQAQEKAGSTQWGGTIPSPSSPTDPERGALAPPAAPPGMPPGAPPGAPGGMMPPGPPGQPGASPVAGAPAATPRGRPAPASGPLDPRAAPSMAMPPGPVARAPVSMQDEAARRFEAHALQ